MILNSFISSNLKICKYTIHNDGHKFSIETGPLCRISIASFAALLLGSCVSQDSEGVNES